jgi:hypothetical protein
MQQLCPLHLFSLARAARNRQAVAGQNASRCPSAQIHAVCGRVPKKNVGSMTSERILSRYALASLCNLRNIIAAPNSTVGVISFDVNSGHDVTPDIRDVGRLPRRRFQL